MEGFDNFVEEKGKVYSAKVAKFSRVETAALEVEGEEAMGKSVGREVGDCV